MAADLAHFVKHSWVLVLLLLLSSCTPAPARWQVAVTSPVGSYAAGRLTMQSPDPWAAGRSQDAAVAGVLSTQRLVSAWTELVGPDAVEASLQTEQGTFPVVLGRPQVVAEGAIEFPAQATSLPATWGAAAIVVTIRQPLRDSVSLRSTDWTGTVTTGAGTSAGGRLVSGPVAAAAVAFDGRDVQVVDVPTFLAGLPGQSGYLIALVNRTPAAVRVTVTSADLDGDRLRLTLATSAGTPPQGFNRAALLIDGYSGMT